MKKGSKKELFPRWGDKERIQEGQTYIAPDAIPEDMRTKERLRESKTGDYERVEPVTTLRRPYFGVYAEIVWIEYWISRKEDGNMFYQVNLVSPHNVAFARDQIGTISMNHNESCDFNEFDETRKLLDDVQRFIDWHRKRNKR